MDQYPIGEIVRQDSERRTNAVAGLSVGDLVKSHDGEAGTIIEIKDHGVARVEFRYANNAIIRTVPLETLNRVSDILVDEIVADKQSPEFSADKKAKMRLILMYIKGKDKPEFLDSVIKDYIKLKFKIDYAAPYLEDGQKRSLYEEAKEELERHAANLPEAIANYQSPQPDQSTESPPESKVA